MKLKKEQVAKIAHQVAENLKTKKLVTLKCSEAQYFGTIEAVIQKNLDDERAIEDEVKKLMDKYQAQIASGAIDPQRMFMMMKKQVAKERKFVL